MSTAPRGQHRRALEELPHIPWSKSSLKNLQVSYLKNKSSFFESVKVYGSSTDTASN